MVIPVQACTRGGKPGYKYGQSGHCYTYERGNEKARKRAKQQAYIQGAAIEANTGENELKKEDYELSYDEIVLDELEKFNQCHGPKGRFCSSGGGGGGGGRGGGGGGGSGGQQQQRVPPNGPDGTYLPDANGKYPYPDNYHARTDLKPLVGKQVKIEYWAENIGGRSITDASLQTRCIKDIKVEGVKEPIHHVWAQKPSKGLMEAKWGQKQTDIGLVTAYAKGKRGEPKTMDYSVQPIGQTVNKEVPALDADTLLKELSHLLEKYNHNHDSRGRFATGRTGGGLGSTAAQTRFETTDGEVIGVIDNQLDIPEEKAVEITSEIDRIAANAKVENLHEVSFKELDPQVLAQCEGSWAEDGTIKLVIAVNPAARDYATSRYVEDHMKLQQTGQMPWLASANADDAQKAYKAVLVHEVAHAKMMEHTLKSKTPPINENNPMQGTKTWGKIINDAHKNEGWPGPSLYGRKNPGECFAESVSLLTIRGSTGNKKVDDYVIGVIQE